jgi:diguanylate cyclase (GGDEF)-like protein
MSSEVLPLRENTQSSVCASLPVATDLLQALTAILDSADPGPDYAPLLLQLKRFGATLSSARDTHDIMDAAWPLSTTCRATVTAVQQRQATRRQDLSKMVTLVREAVAAMGEGHAHSTAALTATTTRLDQMQSVTNFDELRELLASEVVTLKSVATSREREHDQVVSTLNNRLVAAEEQLFNARLEAMTDPLTGIGNRRGFDLALAAHVGHADPLVPTLLALFDVDGFKAINDNFGHPKGDELLRLVARSISESLRQGDVVARIGGDEFAVIATGLPLVQGSARFKTIIRNVAAATRSEGLHVSLSCGVSECSAGDTPATLFHRSDTALTEAKGQGKNRVISRSSPLIRSLLRQ